MRCWHGYLSGVRCKWFAYGAADGTTTTWSFASLKCRYNLFSAGLSRLSWKKRLLSRCLSVCHSHLSFLCGCVIYMVQDLSWNLSKRFSVVKNSLLPFQPRITAVQCVVCDVYGEYSVVWCAVWCLPGDLGAAGGDVAAGLRFGGRSGAIGVGSLGLLCTEM